MRPTLLSLLLLSGLLANAQDPVRIADVAALDRAPDVRDGKGLDVGLAAAGVPQAKQDALFGYGDRALWPTGLASDSARAANTPVIRNYLGRRICTYFQDSVPMAVVELAAKENVHMPEELRPATDLYVLLPESALEQDAPQRPAPSKGPRWSGLPTARITKPDELYATYDLADDSAAQAAMTRYGMSGPEIKAVVYRSQQSNWPEGIDTYEERAQHLKEFKKYKALVAAQWAGKVLLIVPAEQNRQLPTRIRPCMDLYFVYAQSGVQVSGRK